MICDVKRSFCVFNLMAYILILITKSGNCRHDKSDSRKSQMSTLFQIEDNRKNWFNRKENNFKFSNSEIFPFYNFST